MLLLHFFVDMCREREERRDDCRKRKLNSEFLIVQDSDVI